MRPTFEQICMDLAKNLSYRSTCSRLKVGTVITTTDFRKVLSWGYNGNASGLYNKCDTEEPGNCGCLHSEENAIINCDVNRDVEKYVFITHMPCKMCAKRLINLGNVKRVYYSESYRDETGINILKDSGIYVDCLA
jgi:dCMP deaminase